MKTVVIRVITQLTFQTISKNFPTPSMRNLTTSQGIPRITRVLGSLNKGRVLLLPIPERFKYLLKTPTGQYLELEALMYT